MNESEKEFPEGVTAGQLYTIPSLHAYVLERSEEADKTVSEFLADEIVPEDYDEIVHSNERKIIKVTPEVNEMFVGMSGSRVTKGEVLAYYVLQDAIETGNIDRLSPMLGTVADLIVEEDDVN